VDSFKDFGTTCVNRIALDRKDNYFATGHPSGIINIYKFNKETGKIERNVLK
jgi:hypothetical protein